MKETKTTEGETPKEITYWKTNAEEDYITTPISVLRYITELENKEQGQKELLEKAFKAGEDYQAFSTHGDDFIAKEINFEDWYKEQING